MQSHLTETSATPRILEGTYLDKILANKKAELAAARPPNWSAAELESRLAELPPTRDFKTSLQTGVGVRAIAEFKRASPSEGVIRDNANPVEVAKRYEEAGAAAISVLCDAHFRGSFADLDAVRNAVNLPILCKDFIIHRSQLVDARIAGADAALLIVAALKPPSLRELYLFARDIGLEVLVEAHTEHEVERALAIGATVIGINNRNLNTFEVDIERSLRLRSHIPANYTCVAESGIRSLEDVQRLHQAGLEAMLVGTNLMRADDPGQALRDLLGSWAPR